MRACSANPGDPSAPSAAPSTTITLLVPDLDFIAVGIGHVGERKSGRELATTQQSAAGALDRLHYAGDVGGIDETEAEVRQPPRHARALVIPLEGDHVAGARALHLDRFLERPIRIANRQVHVRETVGAHHARMVRRYLPMQKREK